MGMGFRPSDEQRRVCSEIFAESATESKTKRKTLVGLEKLTVAMKVRMTSNEVA
jgi:hypothetical protein